jgi:hypothetical protein
MLRAVGLFGQTFFRGVYGMEGSVAVPPGKKAISACPKALMRACQGQDPDAHIGMQVEIAWRDSLYFVSEGI